MKPLPIAFLFAALAASTAVPAQPASPYVGQQHRDIKALSPEEVEGYLAGRGMGLARAAELNGYPGPMHVLELADPLHLSPEQRTRTQALFEAMQKSAIAAGRALVEAERELDRLFRERSATRARLDEALARIAKLQADVRKAHLDAHLAQVEILRPEQVARYSALRGYGGNGAAPAAPHRHRTH